MKSFDEREKSQEAKFAFDREIAFKIAARRNKRLGLWLAERLGLPDAAAAALAAEVVAAGLAGGDDAALSGRIQALIEPLGAAVPEAELRRQMAGLLESVLAEFSGPA